jgi:7-carboxy-7-deazaguanine synthase
MTTKYRVNEIFDSVQGEGVLVGVPSTFIRLQVCTVGCVWCDTKYTWAKGGTLMELPDIMRQVHRDHVVITGGEPTYWNLDPLIQACRDLGAIVQLETSGQNVLKGSLKPDWVTWSPKENLKYQAPIGIKDITDEVKFVVDSNLLKEDVQSIVDYYYYDSVRTPSAFVLMPEGCPPGKESIEKTMKMIESKEVDYRGMNIRFGWRLQYTLNVR